MRFGIEAWKLEFEIGYHYWRAKIPWRFKLTFYIGAVSLVCMIVLAAVCIARALSNTLTLMQKRLSQFASINSQQIEMVFNNKAARLNNAIQSDSVTSSFESLYNGTVSSEEWASNLDDLARYLFTTSLQSFQALYLYDTSPALLFSLANPGLNQTKLSQLQPALSAILPLGLPANGSHQLPSNYSTATAQAAQAAVNASHFTFNSTYKNFTAKLDHTSPSLAGVGQKLSHTKSRLKLNFTTTPEGVLSWLSRPIALANDEGMIDSFSISFSVPVTKLAVVDSVQTSRLVGYCTAICDCSKYLYLNGYPAYNDSLLIREMKNPSFAVVDADPERGWNYLFPMGNVSDVHNSTWNSFDSFPAVAADIELSSRIKNSSRIYKAGGALMNTRSPKVGKASVGYSFATVLNQKWFVTLSLPKAQVEYGYHYLTKILILVAAVLLIFVVGAAFVLTGLITKPVTHIYRGLVLKPRQRNDEKGKYDFSASKRRDEQQASYDATSLNLSTIIAAGSQETLTENHEEIQLTTQQNYCEVPVDNEWEEIRESCHPIESLSTAYLDEEEESPFHVPQPLKPLRRRWISDEFDELIHEYNNMIDKLNAQCSKMEDEVRSRTREARENQRLAETANAAKSLFMMNISHELLTPMNGIMGITAVTIEENNLEAVKASLKTIINSGNILQELLQELLNYATHLAEVEENFKTFSLQNLASDMRATFENRAKTTGVNLQMYVHEAEDNRSDCFNIHSIEVESDYERIKHICTSLISNALKFTHPERMPAPGSNVAIHIAIRKPDRKIEKSNECHPQTAMFDLMVQDNGIGISKDKLSHVFDVFVQGEDALSKQFTGAGLGLALSKLLCERLGGYLAIYTRLGRGTTVICRIPVRNVNGFNVLPSSHSLLLSTPAFAPGPGSQTVWKTDTFRCGQVSYDLLSRQNSSLSKQTSKKELAISSSASVVTCAPENQAFDGKNIKLDPCEARKIKVLVADDNQVMRELIRRMLTLLGVGQVDLATNGRSAIKIVENAIIEGVKYSIIFMDLTMPNLDGIEATTNIRKQLGYYCPVVALTGFSDEQTKERCQAAGLQKVLVKPVTQAQLAETVSELVGVLIVDKTGI